GGARRIPFTKIPHFPQSTAIGHAGQLVLGKVDGVEVAAMQGRVHLYEGYSPQQVAFPIRVFARMGVKAVILTNAAGGINLNYSAGTLVAIRDHINLQGVNPLIGPNDDRFGVRFPDMTRAYDPEFRKFVADAGKKLKMNLHEGVYLALSGPNYETPAEIHSFRTLGADLVGMSTVPEVLAARRATSGRIFGGCNVENATDGLTVCAERVAIFKAISEGERGFDAIAVVTDTDSLTPPCGACRQLIWEFCGDVPVILSNLKGK